MSRSPKLHHFILTVCLPYLSAIPVPAQTALPSDIADYAARILKEFADG